MPRVGEHAMTVRLPDRTAERLALVARLDEMTMTDAVIAAVDEHIEQRAADPEFRAKARNHVTEICELIGETDG